MAKNEQCLFDWIGFLSSPLSTGRIERQLTTRVDVAASVNPEIAVEVHTAYVIYG